MEADIDAARAIAERALRTIDFREEEEKMNVWIAFVNLEHKYGSMDTLNAVFKRAVAESRGKYIHLNLAEAYEKVEDAKGATAIYEKALKKYKTSKKVWAAYQQFKLRAGDHVAARALLARSMQSLSRHKHVEVLLKYASAEFDFGSGDRGRSVFEELVASYPKRTDLWHVYVDKETKCGFHDRARQLFERMIASKANPRNIKTVFKKYMAFEQLHGSAEQQEGVKSKAREYVQQLT
jgi:rRNA biogenesis protein RRP5